MFIRKTFFYLIIYFTIILNFKHSWIYSNRLYIFPMEDAMCVRHEIQVKSRTDFPHIWGLCVNLSPGRISQIHIYIVIDMCHAILSTALLQFFSSPNIYTIHLRPSARARQCQKIFRQALEVIKNYIFVWHFRTWIKIIYFKKNLYIPIIYVCDTHTE